MHRKFITFIPYLVLLEKQNPSINFFTCMIQLAWTRPALQPITIYCASPSCSTQYILHTWNSLLIQVLKQWQFMAVWIRGPVHINYISTVQFIGMFHSTLISFRNLGPFCDLWAEHLTLPLQTQSLLWSGEVWVPVSQVDIYKVIDQCSFMLLPSCICT
jgi:hypothetical protein